MIERTPLFLMANLGSEVSRIFNAKEKSDNVMLENALKKAKEIISHIMQFPEMKSRIIELESISLVISDISSEDPQMHISPEHLKSYFLPFAMRLMQV
jgi:hypothetical protein